MTTLVIPSRFCGPPTSGNGGWTAGALAELLGEATVEVTLRLPPPLETPIELTVGDGTVDSDIASARVVERDLVDVPPVTAEVARAAEAAYPGLVSHPFPTCFSCGIDRPDGLRIFPGPVSVTPQRVAATWTPAEVTLPITWSALDCIGGWAGDITERVMVLGRITARVDRLPEPGVLHVLTGERLGGQGRKTMTASTLYDDSGVAIARTEQTWIAIDRNDFGSAAAT